MYKPQLQKYTFGKSILIANLQFLVSQLEGTLSLSDNPQDRVEIITEHTRIRKTFFVSIWPLGTQNPVLYIDENVFNY